MRREDMRIGFFSIESKMGIFLSSSIAFIESSLTKETYLIDSIPNLILSIGCFQLRMNDRQVGNKVIQHRRNVHFQVS